MQAKYRERTISKYTNIGQAKSRRGDWKCGSGKCDTGKIARVENAGVSGMERQPEIILRQP